MKIKYHTFGEYTDQGINKVAGHSLIFYDNDDEPRFMVDIYTNGSNRVEFGAGNRDEFGWANMSHTDAYEFMKFMLAHLEPVDEPLEVIDETA